MTITYQVLRDDDEGMDIHVLFDGKKVGNFLVAVVDIGEGRLALRGKDANVDKEHRRKGIATGYYKLMAQSACRRGILLVSEEQSEMYRTRGLWGKLVEKGLAREEGKIRKAFFIVDNPCGSLWE